LELNLSEPVAHSLTVLCGLTGLTLFALFWYHPMRRHKIRLGAEPSGIATVAALLSTSRFPEDLDPSDNFKTIVGKLSKRRFGLLENGGVDYASEEQA
jgi:hypothetical protein